MRGVVVKNPVPHGLSTRSPNRAVPLIRTPRTLPRVIDPDEADALLAALRKHRDRAMVQAMLLGGLRRCEVLGLRLDDVRPGEKRLFIADGRGGHQRIVPVSARFFTSLADYLEIERPATAATDRVFVALKGPRRGQPLGAAGLDEITSVEPGRPHPFRPSQVDAESGTQRTFHRSAVAWAACSRLHCASARPDGATEHARADWRPSQRPMAR